MATTTGDSTLFLDTFHITDINAEKYDRVSRITGIREDMKFHLDINHDLFPVQNGEALELSLTSSLALDGSTDTEKQKFGWRDIDDEPTLADQYDYVCYGKVYKFEEAGSDSIKVYASFGGLLLYLEGSAKKLTPLKRDAVYLLLKK